jgi:hypothetical protein
MPTELMIHPAAGALVSTDDPLIGGLILLPLVFVFYLGVTKRYAAKVGTDPSRAEELTLTLSRAFVGLLLLLVALAVAKGLLERLG